MVELSKQFNRIDDLADEREIRLEKEQRNAKARGDIKALNKVTGELDTVRRRANLARQITEKYANNIISSEKFKKDNAEVSKALKETISVPEEQREQARERLRKASEMINHRKYTYEERAGKSRMNNAAVAANIG